MTNENEINENGEEVSEEVAEIMTEYGLDQDMAEKAQELVDEGLDTEEAVELAEEM